MSAASNYNLEHSSISAQQQPKKIVVVGAGYAGLAFAQSAASKLAANKAHITILEKNKYFFHKVGFLRACVNPSFHQKVFIPYDNAFGGKPNVTLKNAQVTYINYEKNEVVFKSLSHPAKDEDMTSSYTNNTVFHGEEKKEEKYQECTNASLESLSSIQYDYLILATGSSYPSPVEPTASTEHSDVLQEFNQTTANIQKANSILVIGGGTVGIEMAGEIKAEYPNKKVMLLDRNTELLSNQDVPKLRQPAKHKLEELGVEVILGEKLKEMTEETNYGYKEMITESGRIIESDAQIICVGMHPTTHLMSNPSCLESNNKKKSFISVNDKLQVDQPGYENVFVIGDASNHPTPKMAYWGMEQGKLLAKSIARHIQTGQEYIPFIPPTMETVIIPIGPNGGISQLGLTLPYFGGYGLVAGDWFTKMFKSEDMMTGRFWKELNAEVPREW